MCVVCVFDFVCFVSFVLIALCDVLCFVSFGLTCCARCVLLALCCVVWFVRDGFVWLFDLLDLFELSLSTSACLVWFAWLFEFELLYLLRLSCLLCRFRFPCFVASRALFLLARLFSRVPFWLVACALLGLFFVPSVLFFFIWFRWFGLRQLSDLTRWICLVKVVCFVLDLLCASCLFCVVRFGWFGLWCCECFAMFFDLRCYIFRLRWFDLF